MKNEAKKIALIFSSVILAVCLAINVVACVVSGDGSISEESSSDQTDPEINEGDSQYPSSDDTEETDDKIVNVEVNNIDIYYLPTSTIDFDAVTLTVTFDDGSIEVLSKKEYDIDDEDVAEDTEFILNTDGLYAATIEAKEMGIELEPGNYEVSYSIPLYKYSGDFGTVTIGDDYVSDLYPLPYENS